MRAEEGVVLLTGGAGFIGRWVVQYLLQDCAPSKKVIVLDDLSNGSRDNLAEFRDHESFLEFVPREIGDIVELKRLFEQYKIETILHLAARINVQDSIDNPEEVFQADVVGTFRLLEAARAHSARFVFVSTCMVYDLGTPKGIKETDPVRPASPYAGSKLAAENLVLGHHHAYGMPAVILRPFNTYGPFQKSTGEGGVVSIFLEKHHRNEDLIIYGDGTQTRDFLYVTDCARFIVQAGFHSAANGKVINAGSGVEISINDLAAKICDDPRRIRHAPHIHPQSEIMKLCCDIGLSKELIDWSPAVNLDEGLARTADWIASRSPVARGGGN